MLRRLSSPLIVWFNTAVACRSDLCVMPSSQSRVRRTEFCSLCLSSGRVVVVDPPPPCFIYRKPGLNTSRAEIRGRSKWPHPSLMNPVETKCIGGLPPPF